MCVSTDRVSFAGLERAPERLFLSQTDVAQRQADLADRVISREAVVVEHLHVQSPAHQLVVRKTYKHSDN